MATREELISGLQTVRRHGMRVMSGFGPDDWQKKVIDEGGAWTRKQAYGHLISTAEITPGFVAGLANLPPGANATDGFDIDAFNAQQVAAKDALSGQELMNAFQTAFDGVIKFVQEAPEETLKRPARFGNLDAPVLDIMDTVLVVHGIAHIYGAGGSPLS